MLGKTVRQYEVLEKIGSGGMGVIYLAQDTRLGRQVALKLIGRERLGDLVIRKRLLREARAASVLDHPNICTIHEIDEAPDGELFIVMAYYRGETLQQRLLRGPMTIDEAVPLVEQILDGLEAAHTRGVVHRDIKPSNIMIEPDGRVKILDFGLATLGDDDSKLTDSGRVVGTVNYMSPEQITGLKADSRSDLWSVGVLLFEMVCGTRPFVGPNLAATVRAITAQEPDFTRMGGEPNWSLRTLLVEALTKNPGSRIQSAAVFRERLHSLRGSSSRGPDRFRSSASALSTLTELNQRLDVQQWSRILVLPFEILAPEEQDFLALGLTEGVTTDLSRLEHLRVVSPALAARPRLDDLEQMISDLRVDYVLRGSVFRAGSVLRINVRLIDARTDWVLWAEKFDGTPQDVFRFQESISRGIVHALQLRLTAEEDRRLHERPITDVRVYDLYLKSRREVNSYTREGLTRAQTALEEAMSTQSDNVLLISALGQVFWQFVNAGVTTDRQYLERARQCGDRILRLDNSSPHGHRLLGMVTLLEGDVESAMRQLQRALSEDPRDTDTLALLCPFYGYVGKAYAGMSLAQRLIELDPTTPVYQAWPGLLMMMAGNFEPALEPIAQGYRMDPGNPFVALLYGQVLAMSGRRESAATHFAELSRGDDESFFSRLAACYRHALEGSKDIARAAISENVRRTASSDLYHSWNLGQCYSLLDDATEAVFWLRTAAALGFINYPLLSALDPLLDSARRDASFRTLMAEIRPRWEAFEV